MSVIELLDNLLLQPLMLLCDVLFQNIEKRVSPGWALILTGVAVNLALLPIYYQMEQSGRAARIKREAMEKEEARFKAHFKGRERYFYTRTLHRQHGYHPIKALFGASDLFLQILVFSTMYRYLISLEELRAVAFLGIPDLARPDGLLGGVNLLPLLMTAANVASVLAYDRKKRLQGLGLAGLFLALLYASPSGLVLYWTSNNVFSWIRNVIGLRLVPRLPSAWRGSLSRIATQE